MGCIGIRKTPAGVEAKGGGDPAISDRGRLPAAVDEQGIPWRDGGESGRARCGSRGRVDRRQDGGESSGSDGEGWDIPKNNGNGRRRGRGRGGNGMGIL